MGFFDALTGAAGHQAATNQRDVLGNIIPNLALTGQAGYKQAGDFLTGGYNTARNDLGTGYDAATGAIKTGAGDALGFLDQGTQGALGQLGRARGDLTANGGAYAPLSALASQYGKGAGLYADALGINGPQGNQNAVNSFQAGPGYNFTLNQGIDAINRRANAAGMLAGGNPDRDAIGYASGLANTTYQQWLGNLSPYNNLQLGATQGAATGNAGINSALAGVDTLGAGLLDSSGKAKAGIAAGQGNSLADLANRYYGGLASNDVASGSALANNAIGGAQNWQSVFQNALPQFNDTFKQDAKASNDASTNQINLGMNLGKLAVGAIAGGGLPTGGFSPTSVSDPTFNGFSLPGTNAWSVRA